MSNTHIIIALVGVLALAFTFERMTGRRQGLIAWLPVTLTGAVIGWFLSTRVFQTALAQDFDWVLWAWGASLVVALLYTAMRSKR